MVRVGRNRVLVLGAIVLVALGGFEAGALGARETGAIREVRGFDSVSLSTSGELIITQGDREALEIAASEADLARIVTEVRGNTLHIGRQGSGPVLSLRHPVFRLTMKTVTALTTHSSGKITASGLRAGSLRIQISSSGGISIDSLVAESVEVRITSSGSVSASGRVERQDIQLTSSGSYQAKNLASRAAMVRVSSSGSATLRVTDSLQASVTSSGSVRYYGSPPEVKGNVTSSGRLVSLGD